MAYPLPTFVARTLAEQPSPPRRVPFMQMVGAVLTGVDCAIYAVASLVLIVFGLSVTADLWPSTSPSFDTQTGVVIAGQSTLVNLAGWVPREMVVADPLALHVEFPAAQPLFSGDPSVPGVGRAIARRRARTLLRKPRPLWRGSRNRGP